MGRDKALLEFEGQSLVLRVANELAKIAEPVILAPGTEGRLGNLGYTEVGDAIPGTGPLGGMIGALRASPHELMAIVAVDMPFANANVLRVLAGLAQRVDAVVPVTADGSQPLHAVYARRALPVLERALDEGPRSVRGAVQALDVRFVDRDEWQRADPSGRFALNLNRAEDLTGFLEGES